MNWINTFELICYCTCAILIADMIRNQNTAELKLFLSGAIAGYILELGAVRITGIYHYSELFWLNLGSIPYQFPLFGGLMWGGLSVCSLRLSKRLSLSDLTTALCSGWMIVSMDLLLDVAAIRLDGGFWVWQGRPISEAVSHSMFMSVIWVNFLGYLYETPAVVYLSLRQQRQPQKQSLQKHLLDALKTALAGVGFVGVMSGLSLLLNRVTDEWFSCIAFVMAYIAILIIVIHAMKQNRYGFCSWKSVEKTALLFYTAMYVFCFAALSRLGILQRHVWYPALGIATYGITMAAGFMKVKSCRTPKSADHVVQ